VVADMHCRPSIMNPDVGGDLVVDCHTAILVWRLVVGLVCSVMHLLSFSSLEATTLGGSSEVAWSGFRLAVSTSPWFPAFWTDMSFDTIVVACKLQLTHLGQQWLECFVGMRVLGLVVES
jgi:hypothetical protein